VGLSHNVEARTSRHDGQTIVEQILRVNSVDLVADPATTRGLFESTDRLSNPPPKGSDESVLREGAVIEARRQLAENRRRVEALIREAHLPSQAASAEFVEQLAAADEPTARALIQERARFYRSLTMADAKPKSKGPSPEPADHGDARRWARQIT
jgi:hypothetical protein